MVWPPRPRPTLGELAAGKDWQDLEPLHITPEGLFMVPDPDSGDWVFQHHLVMEEIVAGPWPRDLVILHEDLDIQNNHHWNLLLTTPADRDRFYIYADVGYWDRLEDVLYRARMLMWEVRKTNLGK